MYQIDKAEFYRWLASGERERVVGYSTNPCACPVALYLATTSPRLRDTGFPTLSFSVTHDEVIVVGDDGPPKRDHLEEWVTDFISSVDRGGEDERDVTAAECLAILDEQARP